MKILTVVGARPQFIKAAVVSRRLRAVSGISEVLVHTGQHYDSNMSDVFFRELQIPKPDCDLGIGSGTHGAQTGRMLEALDQLVRAEQPDWVLVYGDTNSTLAGALAAAKLHVRIAHVEAGLRSFNRRMPEEVNRVLTDHLSDLLFAPTSTSVTNLRSEGRPDRSIKCVGDVMYDAALFYAERAESESQILVQVDVEPKEYILATVHRAENTDAPERLAVIARALSSVEDLTVILPMHPRTRAALEKLNIGVGPNVKVIDPVGYLDMVMLERHAKLIVSDSGGVQKEAFFHGVPCVTLRDETEWVELVDLEWNRLAPPTDVASVQAAVFDAIRFTPPAVVSPYGDGHAGELIVADLLEA